LWEQLRDETDLRESFVRAVNRTIKGIVEGVMRAVMGWSD
jgi:hypothetical protein